MSRMIKAIVSNILCGGSSSGKDYPPQRKVDPSMQIVPQSAIPSYSHVPPPVLMLPAPPVRLALPAPKMGMTRHVPTRTVVDFEDLFGEDFELEVQEDIARANAELMPIMARVAANMARLGMLDK